MDDASVVTAAADAVLDRRYGAGTSFVRSGDMAMLIRFAYDLRQPVLVSSSVFAVPGGGSDIGPGAGEPLGAVPQVIDGDTVYQGGIGADDQWLAVPAGGIAAGPLFPLYWLRGAVHADRLDAVVAPGATTGAVRYRGTLDPQRAVTRADPRDRDGVRASLRETGLDHGDGALAFEAVVDADGLVRLVELVLPVPERPSAGQPSAQPFEHELAVRLELDDVGTPVRLERPADAERVTVEEFVRAFVDEPDVDAFRHLFERSS